MKNICVCEKICKCLFKPKYWVYILCIIGALFLIGGFFASKDLFTGAAAMFTAATLLFGIDCYKKDAKEKKSKFYLKKIIEYFKEATKIIEKPHKKDIQWNYNVTWHHAVDLLNSGNQLSKKLTINEHKKIYVQEYKNTCYRIGGIIESIQDPRFYFGIKYKNETLEELYNQTYGLFSAQKTLGKPDEILNDQRSRKISQKKLSFLCRFLDRLNSHSGIKKFNFKLLSSSITAGDLNYKEKEIFLSLYPGIIQYINFLDDKLNCINKISRPTLETTVI